MRNALVLALVLTPTFASVSAACAASPASSAAPSSGSAATSLPDAGADRAAVDRVLDDWHDAAAHADEARYFDHIAPGGIFLGTDATERWEKEAFRAYAHPHFAKGKAWSFKAADRHVTFAPGGVMAWFDERLDTEKLGTARGSGVVVRGAGGWQIAQYDLSIPIPNERFGEVHALLAR
jgi:hypothetical protein